jgi:hypothetical protein
MVSSLLRGQGVAYIYSWISGYEMQRATTMGSPDKVSTAFLTSRMRAMLYETPKQELVANDNHGGACSCVTADDSFRRIDQRLEM